MKKKNPTIGELQVFGGKLMWIIGVVIVLYELIKSIIDKNFIDKWKYILALAIFLGVFGSALYFIGKYRIEKKKSEEKNIVSKNN